MQLTLITLSPDDLRQVIREEVERAVARPATAPSTTLKYLPLAQASELYNVSLSYLYRISSNGDVSKRLVGKNIQFDTSELEEFFNKKTKRSRTAIDADLKKNGVFPTLKGKRNV